MGNAVCQIRYPCSLTMGNAIRQIHYPHSIIIGNSIKFINVLSLYVMLYVKLTCSFTVGPLEASMISNVNCTETMSPRDLLFAVS
ncbi:hypothetical protein CEXT_452531 [Caerostris extrusa]|uniref:Uncharacterized protein n=1 Tax=Caerostris extrusa TaxID=172846 RepID=A0AAV4SM45_CAEEX|nr:hypothetical protein CEXT_452531 [Caerostris extrusa]